MQQAYDLPDDERRDELDDFLTDVSRSLDHLPTEEDADRVGAGVNVGGIRTQLEELADSIRADINSMPEWDDSLVRELATDHAGNRDTKVRTVDNDVCIEFEVGAMGDETECRYEVAGASGNEWFLV